MNLQLPLDLRLPVPVGVVHPLGGLLGIVGEDEISPSTANGQQTLKGHLFLVNVPSCSTGLDHGILTRHMVCSDGQRTVLLQQLDDIQIGKGRLDHQDVCSFSLIQLNLPKGFTGIGRVHLICRLVSKTRCRVQRCTEGTIESRGVLCTVGHNAYASEPGIVQSITDCTNTAILHIRGGHNISTSLGLLHRLLAQLLHSDIIDDVASLRVDDTVMPISVVGVQSNIRADDSVRIGPLDQFDGAHDNVGLIIALTAVRGLQVVCNLGEEDEEVHSFSHALTNLLQNGGGTQPGATRHGADFLVGVLIMDEQWGYKIGRDHVSLPHEGTVRRGAAVASGAGDLFELVTISDFVLVPSRTGSDARQGLCGTLDISVPISHGSHRPIKRGLLSGSLGNQSHLVANGHGSCYQTTQAQIHQMGRRLLCCLHLDGAVLVPIPASALCTLRDKGRSTYGTSNVVEPGGDKSTSDCGSLPDHRGARIKSLTLVGNRGVHNSANTGSNACCSDVPRCPRVRLSCGLHGAVAGHIDQKSVEKK
mmetsp:Transcript_70560/g.124352  ORF Transcript_70560/g.124352 Transcript_70560/m.124352 type:complete len:533 (-) Transcript_70560:25-1623(-)